MRLQVGSIVMVSAMIAAAAAHAEPTARLEPFGLDGKVVTSLGVYGSLYVGTLGDGVFRRNLADPDSGWISLGLADKRIRAVYPHKFGPLGYVTTAGIESDLATADSARVYCSIFDQPAWVVTDSGIPRREVSAVWSLDGFPDPSICGETFAATIGSAGQVWRRGFNGDDWTKVLDLGVGVGNVVRADPHSGNVWAGGETSIFAPWIAKSTDRGETWHVSYPDLAGDNACNSLVVHPEDPDIAFAGMEGAVIRTSDGGISWDYTGLRDTPAYIYGLALDASNPAHILAGGMIANPNNWALWESLNGGETWQEIPPPALTGPVPVSGISSIVTNPSRANAFFLSTFGHGVWTYEGSKTGVDDSLRGLPAGFVLAQNHPNPFGPRTTLSFEIPASLDGSAVQLAIYDLGGALQRVLVDRRLKAGPHRIVWDGGNGDGQRLSSGVYFCRLRVGPLERVRRISLVR